jgi:6-phosphofructokinase 1
VERDAHGHIRLSEINFSDILKNALRAELTKRGVKMRIVNKDLGYELRCAPPIAFDIDYTRSLGEAAVEFLLKGGSHATITIQRNQMVPIPFKDMMDPETGRTEVRTVNVDSFVYRSARKFMIRLKEEHADDDMLLSRMASYTNMTAKELMDRYGYLMGARPRPF